MGSVRARAGFGPAGRAARVVRAGVAARARETEDEVFDLDTIFFALFFGFFGAREDVLARDEARPRGTARDDPFLFELDGFTKPPGSAYPHINK